jgi:hypothetical protein
LAVDSFTAESRNPIERLVPSASRNGNGPSKITTMTPGQAFRLLAHELWLPFSFHGRRKPFLI